MASVGAIFIAGCEKLGGRFKSGILFSMTEKSPVNHIHEMDNGEWQVEFFQNSSACVARTIHKLSLDEIQSLGFCRTQIALDMLSVKNILSSTLDDPARSNIGVYHSTDRSVLYYYGLATFPMSITADIRQIDASGNVISPSLPPEPLWQESFRYYRLSQSSKDLFEAYRNLFLAFEALLNAICPKSKSEKEGEWLRRSLSVINQKVRLDVFAPKDEKSPIDFIINTQYKQIRCKLQHAKFPLAKLPHSHLNPNDVQYAYGELIRIWRLIAGLYFSIQTGGGVVTYIGFETMMATTFAEGVIASYTSDNTPAEKMDVKISPTDQFVYKFQSTEYLGRIRPGVVRVRAHEDIFSNLANYSSPIHRICCSLPETLFGVVYVEHGMYIVGIDEWEYIQDFKLINSSQPNVEFRT